jgi:MFS family permease
MFGSLFLLTQYFQFVLGYSPLETGVRMIPFAFTMMVVSPLSPKLVDRIGTKFTVALGLGFVTVGLLSMIGLQADTPYANIFWRLMLMSFGMGLTMAPATESVMGSLPLFKAGVGSAVNDTTRQVGGALGVAIVGSVLSSTFGARLSDFFAGVPVPAEAAAAAENSIGAAFGVADQLRSAGFADLAGQLVEVARLSFVDAVHYGVAVAALATGFGVVVALAFLPARAADADTEIQAEEFDVEHAGEGYVAFDGSARSVDEPVADA